MSRYAYEVERFGLHEEFAAIWARYDREELTIRQAHIECCNAINAARHREERPYLEAMRRQRVAAEKAKIKRKKTKEWRAGVAKIMAEVRRREAERGLTDTLCFASDNPLDGERLWA